MIAASKVAPASKPEKNALLIGSDPEVEAALGEVLAPEGWHIERASGNEEAYAKAQSKCFRVVVTGRHTSGRDDVDFLRKVRRVRPHTVVIILTDDSTPADVIASMREHAFGYLSNSFTIDSLKETLQLALDSPAWDDGIEIYSATPNWIRLHVRCAITTADRLLQFMREISDLPEEEQNDVGVAFREMLLNAMEHGGHFDPSQYVEISYVRTSRMVMCRIKDPGEGFSLDEIHHAAVANPEEDPTRHITTRNEKGCGRAATEC